MNYNKILKVKRPIKPQTPPPPLNDSAIEEAVEALQQAAMETQQQEEPVVDKEVFLIKRCSLGLHEMSQFMVLGGV